MSLHLAAATFLKTPELALDQNEAKIYAQAVIDLEAAFPTQIDPRLLAVINFGGVAAMIYGPRIAAIRMRQNMDRKARQNGGSNGAVMEAPATTIFETPPHNAGSVAIHTPETAGFATTKN